MDALVEQKSKREQTHWPCVDADVEAKHRRLENGAETGANARRHIACMRASILTGSVPGEPLQGAGEQAAFAKKQQRWEACDAFCEKQNCLDIEHLVSQPLAGSPRDGQCALLNELEMKAARQGLIAEDLARPAWTQANNNDVRNRPSHVDPSARVRTLRYGLRPSWPRVRNSQTAEQLADAYVALEKVYGNLDDSERVMEMISLDTSVQFEAVRQAYVRHYKRTYATHVLTYYLGCSLKTEQPHSAIV